MRCDIFKRYDNVVLVGKVSCCIIDGTLFRLLFFVISVILFHVIVLVYEGFLGVLLKIVKIVLLLSVWIWGRIFEGRFFCWI